ncbi:MAG: glycosyltransferase family 2 protein [Clostridia bacterium]|nr:glycosyltransferase family 2 protein [Clostridia bacterium]
MPLFSVIVPVYNAAKSIERCVKSIIESGDSDVEIVLVEDCGKDDSLAKCVALAEKYPQVKVFHNEVNRGVSYTRNRAIDNATGEFTLFVDSDDYVAKEYIPTFKNLVAQGIEFAVCGYYNHDEMHSGVCDARAWTDFEGQKTCLLQEEIEGLHEQTLLQQLWNKLFMTEKIKKSGVRFDESISIGEDTRFILDYIAKNDVKEITLVNQPLYHYMRDNNGSLMYKVGYESVEEPLKNLRKMYAIMGLSEEETDARLKNARHNITHSYAYLIMHNVGMKRKEKKRLILKLGEGKKLYRLAYKVYLKEKIAKLFKRK